MKNNDLFHCVISQLGKSYKTHRRFSLGRRGGTRFHQQPAEAGAHVSLCLKCFSHNWDWEKNMSGHKSHLKIQTEAEALVLTPPSTRVMREDLGSACVKMQEISSFISWSLPPDSSSEMVVLSHVGIYWNSKTSISFHQKSQRQRLIFFLVFDAIQLTRANLQVFNSSGSGAQKAEWNRLLRGDDCSHSSSRRRGDERRARGNEADLK